MVVLYYLPDIDKSSGGVSAHFQVLSTVLGYSIDLHLLTCRTDEEISVSSACKVHYLSVRYVPRLFTKNEFLAIIDDVKPDVFHVNSCWIPLCALTAIWAKQAGYKVVYSPHGMMEPWIMRRHYWTRKYPAMILYQRKALRFADVIHATSGDECNNILKLGYNDNVCVVPNCVELCHIEIKKNWHRRKRILYLGRLHEKKGIIYLLEAIGLLRDEIDFEVIIVGDEDVETPEYRGYLIEKTREMGLQNIVRFMRGVYGNDKYELFRESDLFVLPTHSENFGIVVAEALACGTPVITTQGAPWQELKSEDCGWWIEVGTEALVFALRDFMRKSEDELEQMGRRGRSLIERRYDSKAIAEQFVGLYDSLINKTEQNMKRVRLKTFSNGDFNKGASLIKRTLWYFVNALFVRASWNPFAAPKIMLLKLFGAKIGKGVVLKNNVIIKSPWNLVVGDDCWIGEGVWIDNLDRVAISNDVCLSQGAMLLTGNHDYKSSSFDYRNAPITIEDGAWIGANSIVCPGVTVHSHAILTVGSIATKDLEAWGIYQGNPALKVRGRVIE